MKSFNLSGYLRIYKLGAHTNQTKDTPRSNHNSIHAQSNIFERVGSSKIVATTLPNQIFSTLSAKPNHSYAPLFCWLCCFSVGLWFVKNCYTSFLHFCVCSTMLFFAYTHIILRCYGSKIAISTLISRKTI